MAFCLMALTASAQVVDVLTGLNRPWSLALRNTELFIAEDGTGKIIKADISQPTPTVVDVLTGLGTEPFGGMSIKGNDLFFAIYNQGVIRKFDVTQPTPTVAEVVTGIPTTWVNDILIDGDIIYAANNSGSGSSANAIFKIDVSQSPASIETIPVGRRQLGLAKSGNNLYFSTNEGGVYKLDLSQPTPTPELLISVPTAYGLTINGGFLYVSRNGAVSRVDLTQPNPTYEDIVTGIGNTRLCAFDGLDLYISIYASQGKVVKLAINQPLFPTMPTVCGNTMPTNLGGASPTGGVYSGVGVTNNGDGNTFTFDPTAAGGPGTYTVTYTATNGTTVTSDLIVTAAPVIGDFGFITNVTNPVSLLPDPAAGPFGGVYAGPGVLPGNMFDAAQAGAGVHVITYTYADANGCTSSGTGTISVNTPGNDACIGATDLNSMFGAPYNVAQTSGLYNNTNYTSTDEPSTGYECHVGDPGLKHTIWYTFNGDGNTYRIRAVQCSATQYNEDTQVAIYSGNCDALTPVACNDDEDANNGVYNFSVELTTQAGATYRMLVDGYGEAQGEFCLEVTNLTEPQVLPADQCADANDINNLFGGPQNAPQVSNLQNNTGYNATGDPAVTTNCFFQDDPLQNTIWYTFTGDGNIYRIRTVQCTATNYIPNGDTQVAIYTGDCNTPTLAACNDDEDGNNNILNISVNIETQVGVTYRMLIDGYAGSQGEFCLEVTNLSPSAITEIGQTNIQIFPNPTTGIVQLANVTADYVQVFDNTGRMVMHVNHPGNRLDISTAPAGMYFLKIAEKGQVYSSRLVKE